MPENPVTFGAIHNFSSSGIYVVTTINTFHYVNEKTWIMAKKKETLKCYTMWGTAAVDCVTNNVNNVPLN